MSRMKDAAVEYARLGYRVFPLKAGEKIPACAHGVKDATSDAGAVAKWWDEMPNANIGMACGGGIAVVDVDMHNGVNGDASVMAAGHEYPDTLVQFTPSGGRHYVCRAQGVANATNVNNLQGVDVRGEGGYIVVSPSVVNGVGYEWQNWGVELADFPEWAKKKAKIAQPKFVESHHGGGADIERVKAYLARMDAAVQGQGGHVALLKAAEVVAVRFGVPKEEAKSLLWAEFNPRCVPPWDYGDPKQRRDFERKVEEALKCPQHTFGDLRDAACISMVASQEDIEAGRKIVMGGSVKPHEFEKDEQRRMAILNPPGIVGELAEWINENSPKPVPLFSVAAALSVVGTVCARTVTHGTTMTNPFFFFVAPPQSGKSSTFSLAKALMTEIQRRAGIEDRQFFMPSTVTSDSAIKNHLQTNGRLTLVIDECAGFFSEMKGAAKSGGRLASVKGAIKNLYSVTPDGDMESTIYAPDHGKNREPYSCKGACFSFIGGTQPAVMSKVIGQEEILDGFMGRVIFLAQNAHPKTNLKALDGRSKMPESAVGKLAEYLKAEVEADMSLPQPEGKLLRYYDRTAYDVPLSPGADVLRQKLVAWMDEQKETSTHDLVVQNLVGRVVENVMRVALIAAAGKSMGEMGRAAIDEECFRFASALVSFAYNDLVAYCRETGDQSEYEKYMDRIVEYIRRKGTVKTYQITTSVRGAKNKKWREDALQDLIDSGKVRLDSATKTLTLI